MDFQITEEDIYYADIPSDNSDDIFETEPEERTIEFTTIDDTQWFKEMGYYPANRSEMKYFIAVMDILGLMKQYDVEPIIQFTPKRLDALFVILKVINLETVHICENIIKDISIPILDEIFMVSFEKIKNRRNSVQVFLEEYYVDLGHFFVKIMKSNMDNIVSKDNITKFTKNFCKYCYNLLHIKYYKKILCKFGVIIGKDYFTNYSDHMGKIITVFSSMINNKRSLFESYHQIIDSLFDSSVEDDTLLKMIGEKINLDSVVQANSDPIDHISLCAMDQTVPDDLSEIFNICEYDNFVFSAEHKFEMRKYAFWLRSNYEHDPLITITKRVNKIGMSLYPDHSYSDVLDSFVLHHLVSSKLELVNIILKVMQTSRYEPGIFNKYDTIDLETAFMLLTVSYDIALTYDEMLQMLEQHQVLPKDCPLEFVLRLISRILNITIDYFDYRLSLTQIDNAGYQLHNQTVILFQSSAFCFYLLYPKDSEFIPLGFKMHNPKKNPKIVEI